MTFLFCRLLGKWARHLLNDNKCKKNLKWKRKEKKKDFYILFFVYFCLCFALRFLYILYGFIQNKRKHYDFYIFFPRNLFCVFSHFSFFTNIFLLVSTNNDIVCSSLKTQALFPCDVMCFYSKQQHNSAPVCCFITQTHHHKVLGQ